MSWLQEGLSQHDRFLKDALRRTYVPDLPPTGEEKAERWREPPFNLGDKSLIHTTQRKVRQRVTKSAGRDAEAFEWNDSLGGEKAAMNGIHHVDAFCRNDDKLTCTLFFSPSQKLCEEGQRRILLSRRLTKLLRHEATRRGLQICPDGYVRMSNILTLPDYSMCSVSDLLYIVKCDEKKRYSLRADESRVSGAHRADSGRWSSLGNGCTHLPMKSGNPLVEEERQLIARDDMLTAKRTKVFAGHSDDGILPIIKNSLKGAYIFGRNAEHQENNNSSSSKDEATETAIKCVRPRGGVCTTPYEVQLACPAEIGSASSTCSGSASTGAKLHDCNEALCVVTPRNYTTAADEAVKNAAATEGGSNLLYFGRERCVFSGYVDASQISIRAVQGHSMSVVQSDQLLRCILTMVDLRRSVARPLIQKKTAVLTLAASCSALPYKTLQEAANHSLARATPLACVAVADVCVVHGTYRRCWKSIRHTGLSCMGRNSIHFATRLPEDGDVISGMRSNVEILIFLDVQRAFAEGLRLFISENGVVLSPGNEQGIIECKFFEKVVDRRTGRCLVLDEEENADGAASQ